MADIFISYARADRDNIEALAEALEGEGYSVWWDRNIVGGAEFSAEIEKELDGAGAVIVVWSNAGKASHWVRDEAARAQRQQKLIPVTVDDVESPMGFGQYQAIDLSGWNHSPQDHDFQDLSRALKARLTGEAPAPAAAKPAKKRRAHGGIHPSVYIVGIVALTIVAIVFAGSRDGPPTARSAEQANATPQSEAVSTPTEGYVGSAQADTAVDPASIAVLPFADLSAEGDQEYFSDGMAEEILNVLANVKGLAVASRTSSFQFKGREMGVPEIARKLNVRHVLEGSVRKAGDTLRITAQLIDTQTDRHLWSETFDRPLTTQNVFTIQDEIAQAIVDALGAAMGVETTPKISVAAVTDNLTAYELYLQARGSFVARHNLDRADALLIRALEQDPAFAKAWEIRAALQSLLLEYGYVKTPREDVEKRTLEYAERALALEPQSATAIAVLAKLESNAAQGGRTKVDYAAAIADFDRALEIEPRNASALLWRGITLAGVGDFESALASFDKCVEFEPYYVPCVENRIAMLSAMERDDEALQLYEAALNTSAAKVIFAPFATLARREKKLAFMSATNSPDLFLGWRRHEELYGAIRRPDNTYPDLVADIHRFQAQTGQIGEQDFTFFLVALGDYDATPFTVDYWGASFTGYRKSPQFRSLIKNFGALDYWRNHGFPPQCRPVGDDDFECD